MNASIGVLIPAPRVDGLFSPADRARLAALGQVCWNQRDTQLTAGEAAAFLAECDIAVGSWGTPYPCREILDACPKLRLWEHVAGSVKHMFGPHLEGRPLAIASCAPAIAESVAEMTVGELIVGLRRILPNARANRAGNAGGGVQRAVILPDAVVGVIGASEVGRRVIRLLKPFGPRLLVYDPFLTEAAAAALGVERRDDLVALCTECDAVTLHTPVTPATRHLIGRRELRAMRDDAVFVNTSRGACVDEAALADELGKGRLFAFLDVSDPEPPAPDSPLRSLDNVVYTSHIAGPPTRLLGRQAVDDIERFLRGERPLRVVTADQLDRLA